MVYGQVSDERCVKSMNRMHVCNVRYSIDGILFENLKNVSYPRFSQSYGVYKTNMIVSEASGEMSFVL